MSTEDHGSLSLAGPAWTIVAAIVAALLHCRGEGSLADDTVRRTLSNSCDNHGDPMGNEVQSLTRRIGVELVPLWMTTTYDPKYPESPTRRHTSTVYN
jgi:hypothetical protein